MELIRSAPDVGAGTVNRKGVTGNIETSSRPYGSDVLVGPAALGAACRRKAPDIAGSFTGSVLLIDTPVIGRIITQAARLIACPCLVALGCTRTALAEVNVITRRPGSR